ncbi:unnamed protein product [Pleuronectes platessa]|uniref:Uncharacterized protein n=1 Tax=Pleuronectes platessa TaxID=8262 RepID=A0A9N7TP88_PLEPL|nr:unnamed protein product [Pleuronectes platessa]
MQFITLVSTEWRPPSSDRWVIGACSFLHSICVAADDILGDEREEEEEEEEEEEAGPGEDDGDNDLDKDADHRELSGSTS